MTMGPQNRVPFSLNKQKVFSIKTTIKTHAPFYNQKKTTENSASTTTRTTTESRQI